METGSSVNPIANYKNKLFFVNIEAVALVPPANSVVFKF